MKMAFVDSQLHTKEFNNPNKYNPFGIHDMPLINEYLIEGYVERKTALYHLSIGDKVTIYMYDIDRLNRGRDTFNSYGKMEFIIESSPRRMSDREKAMRFAKYGTDPSRGWIIDKLRRVG